LNSESGFVFVVANLVFLFFSLANKVLKFQEARVVLASILFPVLFYTGGVYFFTGSPNPILEMRLSESEYINHPNYGPPPEDYPLVHSLAEMRSTYAPRNLVTASIRTFDIVANLFNIYALRETFMGREIKRRMPEETKPFKETLLNDVVFQKTNNITESKEESLSRYVIYPSLLIAVSGGMLTLIIIPIIVILSLRIVRYETSPYLVSLIVLSLLFVIVFNRKDIVNSVAVFFSIYMADLIVSLLKRTKDRRFFGLSLLMYFFLMPTLTIMNGFDEIYTRTALWSRHTIINHFKLFNDINSQLGHYSSAAIVFHQPGISIGEGDFRCYNISTYSKQFKDSELAIRFSSSSFEEFVSYVFNDSTMIKFVSVESKIEAYEYLSMNLRSSDIEDSVFVYKDRQVESL
jgi:hypothetical protein